MAEIAVVGAGLMGHGIALVLALGGHSVRITDNSADALDRVPRLMASALETLHEAGAADSAWTPAQLESSVRRGTSLGEAVEGAEIVFEAITEDPETKRVLFERLDKLLDAETIIASNTSYLDVFPLIPASRQPRALIAHWYTPPYIVDLVDVVPGPETGSAVIEAIYSLIEGLGKVPIVLKRFVPGYIANRIQSAISHEVFALLDAGVASPKEIDDAIVHGLSLRLPILGHLGKADFTGIELVRHSLRYATYVPPEVRTSSETVDALYAAGRTGVMSGKGFFDWGGRSPDDLFRDRDRRLLALKKAMRLVGRMQGV